MSTSQMGPEALRNYVRGTDAGRQSRSLSEELNPPAGGIELPGIDFEINRFYIKIFSVRPTAFLIEHGQQGNYIVPACEPGFKAVPNDEKPGVYDLVECKKTESYSRPLFISDVNLFVHHNTQTGAAEVLPKDIIKGEALAKSIVNPNDGGHDTDLTQWGVFITYNDTPTGEEVGQAVSKLKAKYQKLFKEGDAKAVAGKILTITNSEREAAAWLGAPASWNQVQEVHEVCLGCGENVKQNIIMHSCGFVFDWKRAYEEGLKTLSEVPPAKRWPGFPVEGV